MNIFKQLEQASAQDAVDLQAALAELKFNSDGLIPAIAQQHDSRQVLMLAWVNRESLQLTLKTKRVHYWSRSRGCIWQKGETSGHTQELVEIRVDCDADTLLLLVNQTGPACHTNRDSCFYNKVTGQHIIVD